MVDTVAVLDHTPEPLRRLAYRIASGRGVLGRLADATRFRYSEQDVPALPSPSDAAVRLLIGPANSAGQGYEWARAVDRNLPGTGSIALHGIGADPFRLEADLRVPVAVYQRSSSWHAAFEAFLGAQTHLIWESGLPLLGREYEAGAGRELTIFRDRGVRGALLFHGSDIRPPFAHAARERWSPFSASSGGTRALADTAARNAALAEISAAPVFVSTPDLLQWWPDATWLPVVVEAERWRPAATTERRAGVPVVAHAPSQKWLKGTDLIEPMLRRLSNEGVIDYRQLVGVPHSEMPGFYADADIVVDQFVLGIYGVAACEAMASGRLVMSHVDEATRAAVEDRTGRRLPIHEATVESLEGELRRAAADPEMFASLRNEGPDFVRAVHDGRRSAAALAPFLGLSA